MDKIENELLNLNKKLFSETTKDEKEIIYKRINSIDPFNVKSLYFQGMLLQEKDQFIDSIEKFKECITKSKVYKEEKFGLISNIELGFSYIKIFEFDSFLNLFSSVYVNYYSDERIIDLCLMAVNTMIDEKFYECSRIIDFYLEKKDLSLEQKTEFTLLKGIIGISKNNVFFAKNFFAKAISKVDDLNDKYLKCRVLANYGVFLEITGKESEAKTYYNKSKLLSQDIENYDVEAEIESNLGIIRYNEKDFKSAIFHFKRTVKLYEKINDFEKIGKFNANIGYIYQKEGKFSIALKYYNKSRDIFVKIGNAIQSANISNILGEMNIKQNNFEEALANFNEALNMHSNSKVSNKMLILVDYKNISRVNLYLNNYELALKYYEKALTIANEISNFEQKALILNYIGSVYIFYEKYSEAEEKLLEAEKIMSEYKVRNIKPEIYKNITELYYLNEKYTDSLKYAKIIFDIYNSNHDGENLSWVSGIITKIYFIKKDYILAKEYGEIAVKINKSISNTERLHDIYVILSDIYKKEKDSKNSNIYKSLAYQLKRKN